MSETKSFLMFEGNTVRIFADSDSDWVEFLRLDESLKIEPHGLDEVLTPFYDMLMKRAEYYFWLGESGIADSLRGLLHDMKELELRLRLRPLVEFSLSREALLEIVGYMVMDPQQRLGMSIEDLRSHITKIYEDHNREQQEQE